MPLATAARRGGQPKSFPCTAADAVTAAATGAIQAAPSAARANTTPAKSAGPAVRHERVKVHETERLRKEGHERACPQWRLLVGSIAGLVLLDFLPTMIGIIRKVESLGLLIFLNVLPTGVGWFAAMVMAFMPAPPRAAADLHPPTSLSQYQQAPRGYW